VWRRAKERGLPSFQPFDQGLLHANDIILHILVVREDISLQGGNDFTGNLTTVALPLLFING